MPRQGQAIAPWMLRSIHLRLALEVAGRLERSGLDLEVGVPAGHDLPADAPLPDDARGVSYGGSRRAWLKGSARAGDLVLMPAAGDPWIIGIDAASSVRIPGVSVAVVAGPFAAGPWSTATSTGTAGLAQAGAESA
jgi:hypothetical protein